jgi:hypothetical protein
MGIRYSRLELRLLKKQGHKSGKLNSPVPPDMADFAFIISVFHAHVIEFFSKIRTGVKEKIRFSYPYPIEFVSVFHLCLKSGVEIFIDFGFYLLIGHDGR